MAEVIGNFSEARTLPGSVPLEVITIMADGPLGPWPVHLSRYLLKLWLTPQGQRDYWHALGVSTGRRMMLEALENAIRQAARTAPELCATRLAETYLHMGVVADPSDAEQMAAAMVLAIESWEYGKPFDPVVAARMYGGNSRRSASAGRDANEDDQSSGSDPKS